MKSFLLFSFVVACEITFCILLLFAFFIQFTFITYKLNDMDDNSISLMLLIVNIVWDAAYTAKAGTWKFMLLLSLVKWFPTSQFTASFSIMYISVSHVRPTHKRHARVCVCLAYMSVIHQRKLNSYAWNTLNFDDYVKNM